MSPVNCAIEEGWDHVEGTTKVTKDSTGKPSYSARPKTAHSNEGRTETRECKLCEVEKLTFL